MKLQSRTLQVLDEAEMKAIFETALRVWDRVPLRCQGTEEFNDLLSDFGCVIDGDLVTFPRAVRDKVLGRIAERKEQVGPWRPAEVESDSISFSASGQALYYCEIDTDALRPATEQDLADWSRLCDAIPNLERAHPTFIPQDVPAGSCDVHAFATIMLNSSRPWRVSAYSADMIPYLIELQAVWAGSVDAVRKDPIFATKCWYNSPFMITRENIEIAMAAREALGLPFQISTMPVAGIAVPATLAGALVAITAEAFTCNAITLAIDDRTCGMSAGALTFDMKAGIHTQIGPDVQLLRLGVAQMGAYLSGGPYTAAGTPTTMAKIPGAQSTMEKAIEAMWCVSAGMRSFSSLGVLACADIGSPVQLMLDLELMSYLERLVKGITVDEERLAEEVICEVAPTGARFIDQRHTVDHYRDELWIPQFMDRRVPMAWAADPTTMVDDARKKAKGLIAGAPNLCPLSDAQKAEVKRIVAEADRHVAATKRV